MIKRYRLWIKELNLSQQLLTIIFVSITIFALFFFVYLSENINTFVDKEMYRLIHRAQDNFSEENELRYSDPLVNHIVVDEITGNYFYKGAVEEWIVLSVVDNSRLIVSDTVQDSVFVHGKTRILFSVRQLEDEIFLVTILSENYRSEFKSALLNSVTNISGLVVGVLFVILMIWVGSLIHPLNQIRNYIEKVRKGEESTLRINRRDEIGEVADALVVMRDELHKQDQIKEEMVQNISHDLKTPIATIKSYAESIKDGIYPYETLEKSVDVIVEHANRLEKKVYSLIMLNKMGYLNDNAEEGNSLNMEDVINKVILSMEVLKENINITSILHPVLFHGEEEPWRIVIENLLDNAIRYAKSEIVITLNEDELEISNDGPLLSKERKEKLFNPYEKGTDGKFGLGLSIVHRVCTTYGYRVVAENLDDGVLFRISKIKVAKNSH